jgi:hypothetical protein
MDTGDVVVTYKEGHAHICIDLDPEAFAQFAGQVNGALGDSKMAAS